jgi:hypothetical protein
MAHATVITHARVEPWSTILDNGLLKTWALGTQEDLFISFGNETNRFLARIDRRLWQIRFSKKSGILVYLLEKYLKKIFFKIRFRAVNNVTYNSRYNGIQVDIPDLHFFVGTKILSLINFLKKSNYNYFVLTTTSSYLNQPLISQYLQGAKKNRFAAGRVVIQNEETFLSGSFRIFSYDILELIASNIQFFDDSIPEDLAISRLLTTLGIEFQNLQSIDISDLSQLEGIKKSQLENIFHFRLKSGKLSHRNDVSVFHSLHNLFNWEDL